MIDTIFQYIICALLGAAFAGIGIAFRQTKSVRLGVKALLRNQIIQAYTYNKARKHCPIYALETVEDMYQQYHNLGGNGAITKLVEDIKKLPTEPPEKKSAKTVTQAPENIA